MKIRKYEFKAIVKKKDVIFWIFLVMLTLPHMNPRYLDQVPWADLIKNIWRVSSFLIISLWVLLRRKGISKIVFLICIQQAFLFLSTVINKGDIYAFAVSAFSVLSIAILYDIVEIDKEVVLSSQLFCFELVIYINLMTEIFYPSGLYTPSAGVFISNKNWFLGYYNNHTQFFIPALLFAYLYYKLTHKKIRVICLTIAIYISAFLGWSGGVIISLFAMTVVYIFFKNRTTLFNYYTYWLLHIFFFLFIIVWKMQNMFRWLLEDILGKWGSLLGRLDVWDRIIKLIFKAPVLGHGVWDSYSRVNEIKVGWAMHAHNMLLELLYQGGIINLILWAIIVVIAGRSVYQYRDTAKSKIISIAFLGWCVATLVEPFTTSFLMGMFVIAYKSNYRLVDTQRHVHIEAEVCKGLHQTAGAIASD